MPQQVYDEHAGTYDSKHREAVRASGYDVSHFYEYKVKEVRRVLAGAARGGGGIAGAARSGGEAGGGIAGAARSGGEAGGGYMPKAILDFGCGTGNVDPYLRKYFPDADIYGIDISEESVRIAVEKNREHNISYAALCAGSDTASPFDVLFDLVFVSCVFQHAPKAAHNGLMSFLCRNMNPGACLFMFEHNPFNPVTRSVFSKWDREIDKDADLYAPAYFARLARAAGLKVEARRFTVFFPEFLSVLAPLEKYMGWIPFGAQYYIVAGKI